MAIKTGIKSSSGNGKQGNIFSYAHYLAGVKNNSEMTHRLESVLDEFL